MANFETQKELKISKCTQDVAFQIPMWTIQIADWEWKKNQLLSLVDWDNPKCKKDDGFTDYFLHLEEGCSYIDKFNIFLSEEFMIFTEKIQTDFYLRDLWAQRYYKQDGMACHTHGTSSFSGVLYAEFDPNERQATKFMAPFNNFITDRNLYLTPPVIEGSIILFPSMLPHFAEPNKSFKPRTIFSFNLICKGSTKV